MKLASSAEISKTDHRIARLDQWQSCCVVACLFSLGLGAGIALSEPRHSPFLYWLRVAAFAIALVAGFGAAGIGHEPSLLRQRPNSGPRSPHDHWCSRCKKPLPCENPYSCKALEDVDSCRECVGSVKIL